MSTPPTQTLGSSETPFPLGPDASVNQYPPPPAAPDAAVRALRELLAQHETHRPDTRRDDTSTLAIPGYEVVAELGRGGMARVYRARQLRLERTVALKVILAGPHADAEQRVRFQNEAEAVARLQHPNIVQIYEVGEHSGWPYLVLEFVEGGSLAQRLRGTPLPGPAAAALVEVLAQAVDAAHARGIVHRDLKPANVLLTADGVPKIGDFGLAKQLDDAAGQTQTGAILGTPSYMAPEQAEGKVHQVGPPADVYALGAILYECLTGLPPFRSPSVFETLDQVRNREPVPPRQLQPGLPRDLQTICLKCLEKDPLRRYSSARALADDLGRFRRGEPIHARRVGPGERLLKWARRRPALAALGGFSVLAVLALVVGGVVYQTQLVAALRRAERNEVRADAGYQNARSAMQRMLGRLHDRNLAQVPQLRELQRQQYEDALAFYREILAQQDDPGPAVRLDAAVAYREAGITQHHLGQTGPAEENYRQAVAVLERLTEEYPENDAYRGQLASTCNNLGSLMHTLGRKDESEHWHRKALQLREELHRSHPHDPVQQKQLAQSYHNLGTLYHGTGRDPTPHFEKSLELGEALTRAYPDNVDFAGDAADTCSAVGLCYLSRGQFERAEEVFRKAEAVLVALARDHPMQISYVTSLAAVRLNWGLLLQTTKRRPEALGMYDKAVSELEALLRREPNLLAARDYLLNGYGGRAQTLGGMGQFAQAIPSWDRVLELSEKNPSRDLYRLERALNVARAGDHVQAASEADEYAKREKDPVEWLYHLACVYARAAEAAGTDERLAAEEQRRLTEEYVTKALKMLVRARDAGYFSTPQQLALLRNDAHMEPLRKRADYLQLLQDIEKGR